MRLPSCYMANWKVAAGHNTRALTVVKRHRMAMPGAFEGGRQYDAEETRPQVVLCGWTVAMSAERNLHVVFAGAR